MYITLLLRKTWILDQEVHLPQIPDIICGTNFSLLSLEEWVTVWLSFYMRSFNSFDGTAEDSDNPLWIANWYKDFWGLFLLECQHLPIYFQSKYDIVIFSFSPALNMSFNFFLYSLYYITTQQTSCRIFFYKTFGYIILQYTLCKSTEMNSIQWTVFFRGVH